MNEFLTELERLLREHKVMIRPVNRGEFSFEMDKGKGEEENETVFSFSPRLAASDIRLHLEDKRKRQDNG